MGELAKEDVREWLGNIDQIRDIIFGSQLRMSEMLLELGMRMKGAELIPNLREVADNGNGYVRMPLLEPGKPSELVSH